MTSSIPSVEIIENWIILFIFISTALFFVIPQMIYSFIKKINIARYMDYISYILLLIAAIQPIFIIMSLDNDFSDTMIIDIIKNIIISFVFPLWVLGSRHIQKYGEINADYKTENARKLIKIAKWELMVIIIFFIILTLLIISFLFHGRVG